MPGIVAPAFGLPTSLWKTRSPCGSSVHNVCMSHAESIITDQVRERVRRDGVDLRTDRELAGRYVSDAVRRYSERALGGSVPLLADEANTTRQIVAALTGFGALQPFFDDAEVEEIWINSARSGGRRLRVLNNAEGQLVCRRLKAATNQVGQHDEPEADEDDNVRADSAPARAKKDCGSYGYA
jgi:hypothetical protein